MIMNEESKLVERIPLLISFLSVYILISGGAYTLGFWAIFPINIFDFIGVVDIAKSSIPGLMVSVIIVSGQVFQYSFSNEFKQNMIPTEENKYANFLVGNKKFFHYIFVMMPISLYAILAYAPKLVIEYINLYEWLLWGFVLLGCLRIYIFFASNGYIKELNSGKYMLGLVIIVMFFVPSASFAIGFNQAKNLIGGVKYSYVISTLSDTDIDVSKKDRYLGYYGGKYFLWDPNAELVKINSSGSKLYVKAFQFDVDKLK